MKLQVKFRYQNITAIKIEVVEMTGPELGRRGRDMISVI